MLKLYYAVGSDPIVVGGLDYSTYYKQLIANNPYSTSDDPSYGGQTVTAVDNNFVLASGLDTAIQIDNYDTSWKTLPLYQDAECTKPLGMYIEYHNYAVSTSLGKMVRWFMAPDMGYGDSISKTITLWEGWAYPSGDYAATQLYSPYLSKTDEDTMITMFKKMIEVESEIAKGDGPKNVERLSDCGLLMPFITIQASTGLTGWVATMRKEGDLKYFVNAATMFYLYYRSRVLPVSEMTINGASHFPAMAYNPTHFEGTTYKYSAKDSVGNYTFGYDETILQAGYSVTAGEYDVDGTTYTESAYFNPLFIQLPGNMYQQNAITMKSYLGATIPNNTTRSRYLGWDNQIAYLQGYTYTNPLTFILQTAATNSIKNSCLQTGTSNYQISTELGVVPKLVIAQVPNVDTSWYFVEYINNPNTNTATGDDWIDRLFAGDTNPEDSDYHEPTIDDDIPDKDESDFGGKSDEESVGGDGTWTADDDDTTTDFDNDDLSEDDNSPLPDGVFDDLNGNVYYVKLNATQFADLCDRIWVDSEKSILRMLHEKIGQAQVNQGVVSCKSGFIEVPSQSTAKINAIAGYNIDDVGCSTINQYNRYNFGEVEVQKVFGSFLDYQTQIELSLPFAQTINIPPEICMGKKIQVGLTLDAVTGAGMYTVQCDGHLLAEVPAQLMIDIPLSASEYTESATQVVKSALDIAQNTFTYQPAKAEQPAFAGVPQVKGYTMEGDGTSGKVLSTYIEQVGATAGSPATPASFGVAGGVAGAVSAAAQGASLAVEYDQSRHSALISGGGGPGTYGAMGNHYAMLRISRPYVRIDDDYYHFNGAPSDIICPLSGCVGYTEIAKFLPAKSITQEEFIMLQNILTEGVYF